MFEFVIDAIWTLLLSRWVSHFFSSLSGGPIGQSPAIPKSAWTTPQVVKKLFELKKLMSFFIKKNFFKLFSIDFNFK